MKKKLLFIAYWYPPFQVIGAQRAASFVRHLQDDGWEVAVVTVKNHRWAFNGRRSDNATVGGEKVYRLKGFNIAESLKKLSKGRLKGAGQSISTSDGKQRPFKNVAYSFYNNIVSFPDECSFWYLLNRCRIAKIARDFQPDVIFSSALPASSHLLAAKAQKACKAPWVAEYRDLWTGNPLKGRREKVEEKHKNLEKKTMYEATRLITVSQALGRDLEQLHSKPVDVVYNGFEPSDFTLESRPQTEKLTIVYTGMVYPQKQHPEFFFEALGQLPSESGLLFKYYGPNHTMLKEFAVRFNVESFCEINDSISRDVALKEQQNADLLLLFSFDVEGCLSGKVFEYLGAGRPILILGKNEPELQKIVIENKAGIHCRSAKEVQRELTGLLAKHNEGSLSYEGLSGRYGFTRKSMALKLSELLKRVIKT